MSTLFAEDDGGGSPSGDVAEGVDVDDLVALGQELGDFGIVLDRILVLHRYNLDVGVFRAARPVGHVIEGQDAGHFLFLHSLSDMAEALGNHPEDVLEVVGDLMTRFVACTVALAFAGLGVVPEGLADSFLHNPANLAAGGIVFYTNGDVPKEFAIHEFEAFASEIGALLLDEFGFRVAFVFHVG